MTIDEIKKQLIELKDNLQSFKTSDAELVKIYKNDIEALRGQGKWLN